MANNNEINFTTQEMEKLWTDLSQVWPAVKNNPDIAEKIEKLWDVLKASNDDPLALDSEIQNLLNDNNNTPLTSIDISSTAAIQADQDLDSLLAEILGENYQDESSTINNNQNIAPPSNINSDTEELDKLVASILGDDWLNEDSTTSLISEDSQNNESRVNIDSLVSSIIEDEIKEDNSTLSTEKPYVENHKLIDDKQDIDELLNEILNESDSNEESTSQINKAEESIDDLDHESLNKEPDFLNIASSLSHDKEIAASEEQEDIDDLAHKILNKESDFLNTASNLNNDEEIATSEEQEENIDVLIHQVLNKETSYENTTLGLNKDKEITTDNEENIDDLIYEILNDETDISSLNDDLNIEKTDSHSNEEKPLHQENDIQTVKKITSTQTTRKKEPASYKQGEKQNSNTLIIITLVILILLIAGVWRLFFSREDITTKTASTRNQQPTTEQKQEEVYQPSMLEEYQLNIEPKQSSPVTEENSTDDTSLYSGGIEQNKNDITITLNSPETAIESNDSAIFTENETHTAIEIERVTGNHINAVESITRPTVPVDQPSEHVEPEKITKKEKPAKTILKRKIIIHRIVKGDTLWAIAKRYVNNPYRYRELAKLSKIKNPDRIYPGNKVKIMVYIK